MKKTLIFYKPEYADLAIKLRDNYRAEYPAASLRHFAIAMAMLSGFFLRADLSNSYNVAMFWQYIAYYIKKSAI